MVPGERALETGNVVLAQRETRILLGRAAWYLDQGVMRGELSIDLLALFLRQENTRDCGDWLILPGRLRAYRLAVDKRALVAMRMAEPP